MSERPSRPRVGDLVDLVGPWTQGQAPITRIKWEADPLFPTVTVLIDGDHVELNEWDWMLSEAEGGGEAIFYNLTRTHVAHVRFAIWKFREKLRQRALIHDASRLQEPEFSAFAAHVSGVVPPADLESAAAAMEEMRPARKHHLEYNDHHPEHHEKGLDGMDLLQIIEMYCDWCAAAQQTKGGSIRKEISQQAKTLNMSPQLTKIFRNTTKVLK